MDNAEMVLGDDDQDIEDILNGALDPFEDCAAVEAQPQNTNDINQAKGLDFDMILEGINQIRKVDYSQKEEAKQQSNSKLKTIDTNQMVNKAIQKKK